MSASITLIGLVAETHYVEDIRTHIPYRTAVQVPAELAHRSRDLKHALQERHVMQLGNVLPAGSVYRGTGAVQGSGNPNPVPSPGSAAKEPEQVEKAVPIQIPAPEPDGAVLTLLATMAGQLAAIQKTLATLKLQGGVAASTRSDLFSGEVPMFIPDRIRGEASEVSISVPESKVEADLSGARGALRALRGKS